MATIQDRLNLLSNTKKAIKNAIIAKGVSVADTDTFASYADKIAEITTGGGGEAGGKTAKDVIKDICLNSSNQIVLYDFFRERNITQELLNAVSDLAAEYNFIKPFNSFYKCVATEALTWKTGTVITISYAQNTSQAFINCPAAGEITIKFADTIKVTDLSSFFASNSNIEKITMVNMGNAQKCNSMFNICTKLTEVNGLDLSSATSADYLFQQCESIKAIDLSTLTSKCTSMKQIVTNCSALEELTNVNINGLTSVPLELNTCPNLKKITFQAGETACTKIDASATKVISGGYFQDFIDSLPTNTASGSLILEDAEQTLVTTEQAAAITAKGWTLSYA